ncbi:YbjN domain-containing protein [Corynebacterium sp. H128]|uniref:YbjN domain-containing protein n=1 Tax=Corynebacterium sp. H128 TaxID=3133427 RepID=UPI00309DF92C
MSTSVTLERVAAFFAAEGLGYIPDPEQDAVLSGFDDVAIAVYVREILLVSAQWRAQATPAEASVLLEAANEWNAGHPAPIVFLAEEDGVRVQFKRGISLLDLDEEQLGYFLASSISAIAAACQWFAQKFPALVTWESHE